MLQYCVCLLSVLCTECIAAKRCVLEQKLLLTAIGRRIWEIDSYRNEWPWPLFRGRIKVMSTSASHSRLNISETAKDRQEAWFKRTNYRKWPERYQMVTWPMTSRDPRGQTCDPNTVRAQYQPKTDKWHTHAHNSSIRATQCERFHQLSSP